MPYHIRKAAVIGSGTMGGGIAALLAGVGIETLLLDMPAPDTTPNDRFEKRNAVALNGLKQMQNARPAQLFHADDLNLIRVGNIDDDLAQVRDVDWVIEVVVEKLDVKQKLIARLAPMVGSQTIVSTNTSGLPINRIAEGLPEDFTRRFLGTHFFNPPRYLHLLELIPHANTESAVIHFMTEFATRELGKGVVLCKDTPNFIGNRFMSMIGMQAMNDALDHGYTVEEVDALTGPLIGRPKTATFNLNDLVGFDVAVHVARNLYDAIPNDPAREVLNHPKTVEISQKLLDNNWLGRKTGQGFYHMRRGEDGSRELWALNLDTLEYEPPTSPRFDSVSKHRKVSDVGERIRLLINEEDRAAEFLFRHHAFYLSYASQRVPEITASILNVDLAQKWGFGHKLGPFEIWDSLGVAEKIPRFEAAGYPVADWVKEMVANGTPTFYRREDNGLVSGYYSPSLKKYVTLEKDPRSITVDDLRARGKEIARNDSASIFDMGDGVALWEFHSKQNTIDNDLMDMGYQAIELLNNDQFDALVVGNDGERFSVGFNLFLFVLTVQNEQFDQIESNLDTLQNLADALRYASKPVVAAPFQLALGGGTEMIFGGSAVVAHAELYAGLVEVGVGIIPAGGGCKEMLRRVLNPVMRAHPNADPLPHLQKLFQQIATAQVSEQGAKQARDMGILGPCDRIVMNRDHLLWEAKRTARYLADNYTPQRPEKIYAAGRDAYAALLVAIDGFVEQRLATEYDAVIARKLAYVLTGGAVDEPGWVDEQVILRLEREVFLQLLREPKTLERMTHMLQTNKPLRN
ncbi:MAG: 3-hydroxyacyl-CoA dehydrogenase [Anaerolineaceae bacterium]|nr:3-hydroxyacyl-CoA dehydrogenase [Anaerolineaceae bacterium]